jgi:hypothetical protein
MIPIISRASWTSTFRILLISTASLGFIHTKSYAATITAGVGLLDEGDDHGRTAAMAHVDMANNWISRGYLWGRTYGPVTETSGILSAGKQTGIFGLKTLQAAVGASLMAEHTAIAYKGHTSENNTYTSTNVGLMLGLKYEIYSSKMITVSASWDSHLFAAGSAIILLVAGRKQIVGVSAGVMF